MTNEQLQKILTKIEELGNKIDSCKKQLNKQNSKND